MKATLQIIQIMSLFMTMMLSQTAYSQCQIANVNGCGQTTTIDLEPGECASLMEMPLEVLTTNCNETSLRISQPNNTATPSSGYDCPGGMTSYWRLYDISSYNTGFDLSSVNFYAYESYNNPSITVNVYEYTGAFVLDSLKLVATTSRAIGNSEEIRLIEMPIQYSFAPDQTFAVEIIVPGSSVHGAIMAVNDGGETSPAYITSASCGEATPKTLAELGYPSRAILTDVTGTRPSFAIVQTDDTGYARGDMLPIGTHNFTFEIRGIDNPTPVNCAFTYQVNAYPNALQAIVCNDNLQVSLNEDCTVTVTPDMILEGGPYACFSDYKVEIKDSRTNRYIGNVLTQEHIDQELEVRVTAPNGNSCWGKIHIQDKAPSQLEDVPVYTTCQSDIAPGAPLARRIPFRPIKLDAQNNALSDVVSTQTYAFNVIGLNEATVASIGARLDISHTSVNTLSAVVTAPNGIERQLFAQPSCTGAHLKVTFDEQSVLSASAFKDTCILDADYAIEGSYRPESAMDIYDGLPAEGLWTISVTQSGGSGTVNNIELVIDQAGGTIAFPTTKELTDVYRVDATTYRIEGIDACGPMTLGYIDEVEKQPCESSYDKIITRRWAATDENGNVSNPVTQQILVYRAGLEAVVFPPDYDGKERPVLSCEEYGSTVPSIDVTGGVSGELCDIVQIFDPVDVRLDICHNSYKILRTFKVLQWCTGEVLEHTQIIKVLDTIAPKLLPLPDTTISTKQYTCTGDYTVPKPRLDPDTLDCTPAEMMQYDLSYAIAYGDVDPATSGERFIKDNIVGYTIQDLPQGRVWIKWEVTDDCGNTMVQYHTVTIADQIAPTAVCDEHTVVSVGGDGYIEVKASSFDDKSHDNCGVKSFTARKMSDICGVSGTIAFTEKVVFCCAEIGNIVMVEFKVTDINDNESTCMVEVKVQDKLPPYITFCPEDIELDCNVNFKDTVVTGSARAIDNCRVESISFRDIEDINSCGEGEVRRTWVAVDKQGLKNSCVQIITLKNRTPFTVDFPENYTTDTCKGDLSPGNLPIGFGYPIINKNSCTQAEATYKDQVFKFVDGACEKILRTWTVLNWCEYDVNLPEDERKGVYKRTQIIKLHNEIAPTISLQDSIVDLYGSCTQVVDYDLVATDDCTQADLHYVYKVDMNNDGTYEVEKNTKRFNEALPEGTHRIHWTVEDGCGNIATEEQIITVEDKKKPTPYCMTELATAVMNSNGEVEIWAIDFNLASEDNCTDTSRLRYTFTDVKPSDDVDYIPSKRSSKKVFTCADIPDGKSAIIPLRMYVWDARGNYDFCDVRLSLQDNEANKCNGADLPNVTIRGNVETTLSKYIKGLKVVARSVGGESVIKQTLTDQHGDFILADLPKGKSYKVTIEKNDNVLNGVNTLDLVRIQRHVLKLVEFKTPYQYIAADINNDRKIKATDLLSLRKVILGLVDEFPNSQKSWRFVRSGYKFENEDNPWPFDEYILMENMQYDANYQNMIAVKIGDLDGDVSTNLTGEEVTTRSSEHLTLSIEDVKVSGGDVIEVPVYANAIALSGYQFTMETSGLAFEDVKAGQIEVDANNFGIFDGRITTAWSTESALDISDDEPLFTLVLRADTEESVLNALDINSSITQAMAIDGEDQIMDVRLESRSGEEALETFTVFQNRPNPFTSMTNIGFYLPTADNVSLKIFDVTGKTIFDKTQYFDAGIGAFTISENELAASGILYYQVSNREEKVIMKMVNVR